MCIARRSRRRKRSTTLSREELWRLQLDCRTLSCWYLFVLFCRFGTFWNLLLVAEVVQRCALEEGGQSGNSYRGLQQDCRAQLFWYFLVVFGPVAEVDQKCASHEQGKDNQGTVMGVCSQIAGLRTPLSFFFEDFLTHDHSPSISLVLNSTALEIQALTLTTTNREPLRPHDLKKE